MLKKTVFTAGTGGYDTYRIPTCISLPGNRVLVFCEGRRDSMDDYGCIRVLCKVSTDGGASFGPTKVVAEDGENTIGNPSPVYDRETGELFLLMNGNLREGGEDRILRGEAPRSVLVIKSGDLGESWSEIADITPFVKEPDWTWHAVGPCHGIQLENGRLLIPCNHAVLDRAEGRSGPYISGAIYSDDHGNTWKHGADVGLNTNECTLAQIADGRVYMNMRSYHGKYRRAVAYSENGGESWSELTLDERLIEPVCQGSALAIGEALLFCNPASEKREKLTLRESNDGGATWPRSLSLHEGPAAYSDLCALESGEIFALYECGEKTAYERVDAAFIRPEELR